MSSDLSAARCSAATAELDELRSWIAGRARNLPPEGLTDDLPLLAGRHLTSLHLPELILLLERLRRKAIDVDGLQAGDFQDIRTIAARFLPVAASSGNGPAQ
jgi:hypothetical protein